MQEEEVRDKVRQERAKTATPPPPGVDPNHWYSLGPGGKSALTKKLNKQASGGKRRRDPKPAPEDIDASNERDWKDSLLATVRRIPPTAFERLCQRILRESGFVKVEVTGRSGDGGIDGAGVLRINLLSFHVRFQCKRYSGTVSTREIRDFRGAVVGRADKGLFLTTGGFTKDAQREAVRDGAPAIDLIDGSDLCDLLKAHGLGVVTENVEVIRLEPEFFDNL